MQKQRRIAEINGRNSSNAPLISKETAVHDRRMNPIRSVAHEHILKLNERFPLIILNIREIAVAIIKNQSRLFVISGR